MFLELHKTGTSHIVRILSELIPGRQVGKHNQAKKILFDEGRLFLGSVRNPWEWYCSLWAYGCDQKGSVFGNVTRPNSIRGLGWRRNPIKATLRLKAMLRLLHARNPERWRKTYRDVNDPGAFREWLNLLHSSDSLNAIGEGYGETPLSEFCGLMTYRFLYLFCTTEGDEEVLDSLVTLASVRRYCDEECFIDYFIRNENLVNDLFAGLERLGVLISDEQAASIKFMPRTNTSSRRMKVYQYYDDQTEQLVLNRDRIIVEKFGYQMPDCAV